MLPLASIASFAEYPLSVKDDSGSVVTVPWKPVRIISLTLPTDEILLALVDPSRILALTTFAADRGISSVAQEASRVPRAMTLSVEPIVALHPDLVFAASWSDAAPIGQLRAAGVPVYRISSATSIAAVEDKIARCALLTGETQNGVRIIAAMRSKIAAVEGKVGKIPPARRLRVLDYTTFGSSMGKGSSWDDVVRFAGLVNAAADLGSDEWGQVPVSTEKLLTIDPDMLILPGWVYGETGGAQAFLRRVLDDPALRGLTAVKTGRVSMMPEPLRSSTSQYIADAVVWLARTAYPELFK
ncbi:MAG TPA: ABC transporter substrate-binding protein [Spirochaetia bacterium]|nr:ABC transporter substrate-binding protein [Spirochaetia bacterium]